MCYSPECWPNFWFLSILYDLRRIEMSSSCTQFVSLLDWQVSVGGVKEHNFICVSRLVHLSSKSKWPVVSRDRGVPSWTLWACWVSSSAEASQLLSEKEKTGNEEAHRAVRCPEGFLWLSSRPEFSQLSPLLIITDGLE